MPRPRTPKAKAKATGQDIGTHKDRFEDRVEPVVKDPLGKPPKWMKKASQLEAWQTFADELPWLNHSHRSLVEIASEIRGRLIAGEDVGVQALNLLRQCLGSMGATPSDASKVKLPDGEDGNDKDPSKKYF
jgi:hypothetical protein